MPASRISEEAGRELKAALALESLSQHEIAKRAGVNDPEVSLVISGYRWNQKVIDAIAVMFPSWAEKWLIRKEVYQPANSCQQDSANDSPVDDSGEPATEAAK